MSLPLKIEAQTQPVRERIFSLPIVLNIQEGAGAIEKIIKPV